MSLGHDVFILSMPLKGVTLGPGSNDTYLATDHEWFRQWEEQGDSPLRYFMEPTYLTVNYAKAAGYEQIYMAGLSGGGWPTTFAAAIDKRIDASFPIAGSLPCDMRNPESWDHPQSWTGDSDEDYEQSCRPNSTDPHPDPTGYACRPTRTNPHPPCPDAKPVRACLFSCLRLAAPLSHLLLTARTWLVPPLTRWRCCRYIGPPGVPLLQLHVPVLAGRAGAGTVPDADSPRIRHVLLLATQSAWKTKNARHLTRTVSEQHTRQFLTHTHTGRTRLHLSPRRYESNIRAELMADGRAHGGGHGWFTATADNHSKHEVCDQDKAIITAALAGDFKPGAAGWENLPCDILHQALPAHCPP